MLTIKQLHEKTLPEYKRKFVKVDFVSYYLWRPICDFVSIVLMDTKITPNDVTIVSFYSCLISFAFFVFAPGMKGALLGYLFFWLWNIADGVDGNLARYRGQVSRSGDLWDAAAGYLAMIVFYFGAGLVASKEESIFPLKMISPSMYVCIGAVSGICTMFPRLITQKKESVYGKAAAKSMKDRTSFDPIKIIALNLVSINGLAGLLFLIAILTKTVNLFSFLYLFIMLAFGIFSTFSIMKNLEK